MDCRQFRKQHTGFIDDMLSGVETWAMRDHLTVCSSCSRFDIHLRRSLVIARQAATLEPSRDFQRKLSATLAAEKLARPAFREMDLVPRRRRVPLMAAAAAVVIGVLGVGIFTAPSEDPIEVASQIAAPALLTVKPALQAATPATSPPDQPVHPAMLLAQRATEQFAASQARAVSSRPTH